MKIMEYIGVTSVANVGQQSRTDDDPAIDLLRVLARVLLKFPSSNSVTNSVCTLARLLSSLDICGLSKSTRPRDSIKQ